MCYLTVLDVEAGSAINGTVTVNGETVDVSAGGHWTGDITVAPADGALEVVDIDGESYVALDALKDLLGL